MPEISYAWPSEPTETRNAEIPTYNSSISSHAPRARVPWKMEDAQAGAIPGFGFVLGNLLNNAGVCVALFAADFLIVTPFVKARVEKHRSQKQARWFLIHSLANIAVVVAALNCVSAVLRDPVHAMDPRVYSDDTFFGTASRWPLTIINSVHVYHMLGSFGKLSPAEYFHHLLFIPTLGFPGQIFAFGALGAWQAFFISGAPRLRRRLRT